MTVLEIADNDFLYQYIAKRRGPEEGKEAYLRGGKSDAGLVAAAAKRLTKRDKLKVLEFASGYGRVTRYLVDMMPGCSITASDIHPEACDFIRDRIGIQALRSSTSPAELSVGSGYDFICVLSLFSHLPNRTFVEWLTTLYGLLAPGGVLMFTTHGEVSKRLFVGIDLEKEEKGPGWTYLRRSDQIDLDLNDYGTMLVTPRYVLDAIEKCQGGLLKSFVSGTWFGHQDEWAVERPAPK